MSADEREVHEEVADAVQAARKERLRDDLLSMVCPSDWTIQAPEPLGKSPALGLLSHVHSCCHPSTCSIITLLCLVMRCQTPF